jgi:hypothetical protein
MNEDQVSNGSDSFEFLRGTTQVEDAARKPQERRPIGEPETVAIIPRAPETIGSTGLSESFLAELVLKVIHYVEQPSPQHLARAIALPTMIIDEIMEHLKAAHLCEIVSEGSTYSMPNNYKFRLTEKGEARAERALERCRYAGPAPVTLEQYGTVITGAATRWRPNLSDIRESFEALILDDSVSDFLERALHSGRSTMIYGPSGNGKTHVLTEYVRHLGGQVLVPHAIYAYGQIIRVFDRFVHERMDVVMPVDVPTPGDLAQKASAHGDGADHRWVNIRRPGVIVGGELTAESLELGYDPIARFYQAPKHLKAQGGILVVDDFGRQKVSPIELLNRWIMALERGRDNLLLRTGENIEVPFFITLLFSTNLNPSALADSAYLRRVPYKAYMPAQTPEGFANILGCILKQKGSDVDESELANVARFLQEVTGELSGSLARDLIMIVTDNADHEESIPAFNVATFEQAYRQLAGIPEGAPLTPASVATNR